MLRATYIVYLVQTGTEKLYYHHKEIKSSVCDKASLIEGHY